jgi:HK97 family phage major capsid protein
MLNDELEQALAARNALRTQHTGTMLPEDARVKDTELVERIAGIRDAIEIEQQRQRDALVNETARDLNDPRRRIQHNINPDDDSRRDMERAGWTFRGGMTYRQTSKGEIAFCPEAVLFGTMPSRDPVAAAHFRSMRASFQPDYRVAFLRYLAAHGDRTALTPAEQNALSEGTDTAGGYLVPADAQAEILARRADSSVMRRLATVRQTSRDRISFPAVAPHASSGSIYSSGFVGGLVGERPTNSDTGPTFQQFEISIKKFEAYTKVTNDLIADASSDVLAFLATDGGRNLGLVEDNYFINGLGTGLEPMGILSYSLTTTDVSGTTADVISNTNADAGSVPKLVTLSYTVPGQYAERSSWLMARTTMGQIHGLVDGENRPWWQPSAVAGGSSGAPATLLGAPVYTSPFVPNAAVNATKELIIGDFSAYIIADRTALSVNVTNDLYAATDEVGIFLRSRSGGGLWNTDALRVGIM